MITNDLNLYMKFQRQPRVLGTICYYAPTNKLLVPPGIKPGDRVFICDYTQSGDDVYVTVADFKAYWGDTMGLSDKEYAEQKREWAANIPKDKKIMVIWKDLAQ
jgi:hypothetical protein